ncbi:type I-C CRISPR-associated protein Cas8c/Csd1 [Lachnospiraceae bacterium 62-35]
MLIKALCDYYDMLAETGSSIILPDGYSNVKIHYKIGLTADGKMDGIIDCQKKKTTTSPSGKEKETWIPRNEIMPQRTEKPGIDGNVIEHRPLYIFGLNFDNGALTPRDRTNKAEKSHQAFVSANLDFLEGLDSPLIRAYRSFLLQWNPEEETENASLLGLGKAYSKSGFAFCLSGEPDRLLHQEPEIKMRWEQRRRERESEDEGEAVSQCAVSGERAAISRVHNKIKGVYGGLATGSVLVGFNNKAEESYGKEQSYNSNISELVMKKYTETLNYFLGSEKHRILMDDMTIVFWAIDTNEIYGDFMRDMFYGQSDKMDGEQTESMLKKLLEDSQTGKVVEGRLDSLDMIDPNVDFYMAGFKPNSSRLALKFIYRKKYGDMLRNIAKFQKDLQISQNMRPISFAKIRRELTSPKNKNETVPAALMTKLFEAVIYGGAYPGFLLQTAVRRVKTDGDSKVSRVRAGIIKACINRNGKKEELKMALDKENQTPAYLCGRLFAVLEKLQQEASGNSLNRTIKDGYFASASSKPSMVFPKLIRLAQNHLNKVKYAITYQKLMGEIINPLEGAFPDTLSIADQGRFIVGYYQQYQSFFEKKDSAQNLEMEEKENGN